MTQPITAARPARGSQPASPIRPAARPSAARAAAAARLANGGGTTNAAAVRSLPVEPWRRVPGLRHLRVVPAPTRTPVQRRRRARALLLAAVGLLMAVALGLVYLHVVLAQRQFALDRLEAKVQTDRATYQNLRLQVAQLGSPQHVIFTAEGKLGMRQPASVTYLTPTVTIGGQSAATATPAASRGSAHAPAGDAGWPQIKSQLAGSP